MSRSIVTGGAGFIGSHIVDALLARGDEVLVIDDLSSGRVENLAGADPARMQLARGDIRDRAFLQEQIAAFRPEQAFHMAAQVDVRKAIADPVFDARANIEGLINLLESLREVVDTGCPLVFASTGGAIYGEGAGLELPLGEGAAIAPESAYGASKFCGEVYLGLYQRLYGMPSVALRFGNVYGPRQDPHGEAGVVAIFCGRILEDRPPTVFGDGLQTRDYVFVADVVSAALAAASRLERDGTATRGAVQHRHRRRDQRARSGRSTLGRGRRRQSSPSLHRRGPARSNACRSTLRLRSRRSAGAPRSRSRRACGLHSRRRVAERLRPGLQLQDLRA